MESLPFRYKVCLHKWLFAGENIYGATKGISSQGTGGEGLQTKKGLVWS